MITLRISRFSKLNWSDHTVWHYEAHRSPLILYPCSQVPSWYCLNHTIGFFDHLIDVQMNNLTLLLLLLLLLILLYRYLYDHMSLLTVCRQLLSWHYLLHTFRFCDPDIWLLWRCCCCYTDIYKVIWLCSQTGAPMVTQWTAIVTLVPYSTAISGAKSIGTQLT